MVKFTITIIITVPVIPIHRVVNNILSSNKCTLLLYYYILFAGASHQEAAERVHAVHEGDAAGGAGRVHAQGVRRHQPDPRPQGENQRRLSNTSFL
jgi:hypothetical protein